MIVQDRKLVGALALGALIAVGAGRAAAQQSLFNTGLVSPLQGSQSDTLPILVLQDVGSNSSTPPFTPDGILDLITADQTNSASVNFGQGDGTFVNPLGPISLGVTPSALVLGDVDGDGFPDMVVASDTSGGVEVLHGNNDGTFNAPGTFVLVPDPVAIALADVNNDNKLDVLVVSDAASKGGLVVLLGDGHGNFATLTQPSGDISVPLGSDGSALVTGHFNGDNNIDVAVTNRVGVVNVLQGDGTGKFSVTQTVNEDPTGKDPIGIAAGDLDKDGHLDLVVVNDVSDNVAILMGKADGTFQAPTFANAGTAGSNPDSVTLFDANGDGKLDIATANNFGFDVSVLLGDGKGNFGAARSFVTDQEPRAVAAGDVNGDGIPDLVAINRDTSSPTAVTLRGQGDGTFVGVEDVAVQSNPTGAIAGDVDNDGLPDLIVAQPNGSGSTGTVLVRPALAAGGFGPPLTLTSAGDAVAVGRGDLNGDGRLDVVAVNKSPANVSVFLGGTHGLPTSPTANFTVGAGAAAVAVGDWNGDGRSDLAVARQGSGSSGAVDILLSNPDGSLQQPPTSMSLSENPLAIEWGDFNKDGKADLALIVGVVSTCSNNPTMRCTVNTDCGAGTCVSGPSTISILLGNGNGTFQAETHVSIPGAGGDAKTLTVADFDGDGFDDIAVVLTQPDLAVKVLYGNGQLAFAPGAFDLHVRGVPWAVAARNLTGNTFANGDLMPDLLVVDQVSNAVFPYINAGASRSFQSALSVNVSRSPISVVSADFDGDGRYDAAAADNQVAGAVSVLTNIKSTPIIRGDANGDHKVSAADLVTLVRKLGAASSTRVEQVRSGSVPVSAGSDANGDGVVNYQDTLGIAARLFPPNTI